jgi:hypothetical protein
MDVPLTQDQLRRIALAKSAHEVQEICNESADDLKARAERNELLIPASERKPRYISVDGFLQEIP